MEDPQPLVLRRPGSGFGSNERITTVALDSSAGSGGRALRRRSSAAGSGGRRLERWSATAAAALLFIAAGASPANAHYREPPGDWNAAPAVVQVETNFRFTVNLPDPRLGLKPYRVEVVGPRGSGAIFDPSGSVIATRDTVVPNPPDQARIEGVNRGFEDARPPGWTTPRVWSKRHTVANVETNKQLQACYAAGSGCITYTGRAGTVVLNTVPKTRWAAGGPRDLGNGLVILPTKGARIDATPTVGLNDELSPNSTFVALGYTGAQQLARINGQLVDGTLTAADSRRIEETFGKRSAGVVLIGPEGKGSVLGVVVPTADGLSLVAGQADVAAKAGYRPVRGTFHQRIDNAIGFFYGEHYRHSISLLQGVVDTLPDAELSNYLKVARAKADTPEDKTYTEPMSSPTSTGGGSLPWPWLVPAGVLVAGLAAVAVLMLRQRAKARRETPPDSYDDFDDYDDDSATSIAPAQRGPDAGDHIAAADAATSAPQPTTRSDPSAGVLQAERPADDQRAARYCTSCGTGLVAGDRFCYHCGAPAREGS